MLDAIFQVVKALLLSAFPQAEGFWPFIETALRQIAPQITGGEQAEKVAALFAEYLGKYQELAEQTGVVEHALKAELFYALTVELQKAVGLRGV